MLFERGFEPVSDTLWYKARETINWVLEHGGSESLRLDNYHGLTPVDIIIKQLLTLSPLAQSRRMIILSQFMRYPTSLASWQLEDICDAMQRVSEGFEQVLPSN